MSWKSIAVACGLACAALGASAQQMIIYPARGQSVEQQTRDQGECQMWAKQTTGVDPIAIAGGLVSARRARMAQEESAAQTQQANAQRQQAMQTYDRALAACLQGRGYTVQ